MSMLIDTLGIDVDGSLMFNADLNETDEKRMEAYRDVIANIVYMSASKKALAMASKATYEEAMSSHDDGSSLTLLDTHRRCIAQWLLNNKPSVARRVLVILNKLNLLFYGIAREQIY